MELDIAISLAAAADPKHAHPNQAFFWHKPTRARSGADRDQERTSQIVCIRLSLILTAVSSSIAENKDPPSPEMAEFFSRPYGAGWYPPWKSPHRASAAIADQAGRRLLVTVAIVLRRATYIKALLLPPAALRLIAPSRLHEHVLFEHRPYC
jgi:hypothetical protein